MEESNFFEIIPKPTLEQKLEKYKNRMEFMRTLILNLLYYEKWIG